MRSQTGQQAKPVRGAKVALLRMVPDGRIGPHAPGEDEDDETDDGTMLFETLPLIGMVVLLFNKLE